MGWLIALAGTAAIGDAFRLGGEFPSPDPSRSLRILDRYGREIRHALSIQGERRYAIPLESIPDTVREAFVLSEDRRFYSHFGVDPRALGRGLLQSIRDFRKVSGGSTITMQLVRIEWPEMSRWYHKPAQILQALRLERAYSKAEILARYLNSVPFGNQISGVGAACRYFFGKSCEHLSPAETAGLAVLPRNPSLFVKRPESLLRRRNLLLRRMLRNAEPLVLEQALREPVRFARASSEFYAPHFTEQVMNQGQGRSELRTTLDLGLQQEIQGLLRAETEHRPGTGDTGAVLVLENETGEVLAYVGSPDYFDPRHGMVDGVRVLRSPGSALKPFVYQFALENGWDLHRWVPDIPMVFSTSRSIYEPTNYGGNFSGPRTLREALANSKNIPALYLASQLGEAHVLNHLRTLGFTSLSREADHYGVGIALGNGEVSLWELTQAYATLARLGVFTPSRLVPSGANEAYGSKRVSSEESAYLVADVLRDPLARQEEFGRYGPLEFDYEVGVKTGTSNDYRDHWTIGFTKKITVGVWRGNADSSPLGQRVSASHGTGPLFHKVMNLVHERRTARWLDRPESIESSEVCAFSGHKPGALCPLKRTELHAKGRAPTRECEYHRSVRVADCRGRAETIRFVELPKEYEEWAKTSTLPTLTRELREKCGIENGAEALLARSNETPRIVEPLDRTTYAIDPSLPHSHQELRLAFRNVDPRDEVALYVNDERVPARIDGNEFYWRLERGEHRFHLQRGTERSNVVQIRVR